MDNAHDYYSILDVPSSASDAEIRRAFRALAKEFHPDSRVNRSGGAADRDFRIISEAYETLKDSNRRAAYDRDLDEARQIEAQMARRGKRTLAVGLSVGLLSMVLAAGALFFIAGADRKQAEKSQDSLKVVLSAPEEAQAGDAPDERTEEKEAEADPRSAPPDLGKPPSPAPAQTAVAAPSPPPVSPKSPAPAPEKATVEAPAPPAKPNDQSFQTAISLPAEPMEIVTGPLGHKKTLRLLPGKGLTQSFADCKSCPEMVVIPSGASLLGTEGSPRPEEAPAHRVHLAKPIAISKSVISAGNWRACVDAGVCRLTLSSLLAVGPRVAATRLTWSDAKTYVDWLSQTTGAHYRLLSEAEWEYAARAGKGRGPMESEARGRYANDASGVFPRVRYGRFIAGPNAWGVQGGGVLEWVEDCWHGSYNHAPDDASPWLAASGGDCVHRVVRGVADAGGGLGWNLSTRAKAFAETKAPTLGFRVAREVSGPAKTALDGGRREP